VFEVNAGQSSSDVRYLARAGTSALFLSDTAATLAGPQGVLAMRYAGANPHPTVTASAPLPVW
jgi:hypothetical protein